MRLNLKNMSTETRNQNTMNLDIMSPLEVVTVMNQEDAKVPAAITPALPMGKPFITAGLGAGFGGMFCMAMKVAATTWGPSGVLALPIMVAGGNSPVVQMCCYAVGLVISYVMGFIITNFTLKDSEVANA